MAQSRIGEGYYQVVPVISNLGSQISAQLQQGLQSAQVQNAAQQGGTSIGTATGSSAGQTAGNGLVKGIMGALAAAGIAKVLGDIIGKGFEQQGLNNRVSAALNLTAEESAKVAEASRDLYSQAYGESYESITDSMQAIVGSIKEARYASKDQLVEMAKDVTNLSSVYGLDAEMITQAAQSMIGTGLASDFNDALETILAGYQTLGSSGEDFLESLNEFSDDFKNLGLTGKEGIQILRNAIDLGIKDTDAFADALNEVAVKAGDFSADEGLVALGFNPDEVRANFKAGGDVAKEEFLKIMNALQAADDRNLWASVFGTKSEDYFYTFQNLDLSSMNKELEEGIGNLQKFDETLNQGGASSMEAFRRTVEMAFVETLAPILEAVTPLIADFVGFIRENEGAAMALGLVVGGILLASVVALTAALYAAIAPVLANPITYVVLAAVAAVALLGVAIYGLIENWDGTVQFFTDIWAGFMGWLGTSIGELGNFFVDLGKMIGNFFIGAINQPIMMLNFLIGILNSIKFKLPDWMGGYGFDGFNLPYAPTIPALANGATVKARPGGTLALIAEAGSNEAVVDEGLLNRQLELSNASLASGGAGGSSYTINQQPGESSKELTERLERRRKFVEKR